MNQFQAVYPTLYELLEDTPLEDDTTAAIEIAQSRDDMKEALQTRVFALNELMWLLFGAVDPDWMDPNAVELEKDLSVVVGTVGIASARTAYKDKFLVDDKNKLDDVRYEIAVTAKACAVLDSGSIELEKPISDPRKNKKHCKNSDVFGSFQGQPVRIEVTVLHESLPPAIHLELDDLVKQADVSSDFVIILRSVLIDRDYAERVRALLELLHESHVASTGKDVEIDGVHFEWKKGAYHCRQETSPFESICFYSPDELKGNEKKRDIIHPCSVRNITPKYMLEDYPNPPGVITSADLPDAPTQVPVSTKVHQMLEGKLQQCERGVVNIVALGNPFRMNDREVMTAVRGTEVYVIPFETDKENVRRFGKGMCRNDPKAPFVPAQYLAGDDDRATFVEPFRKMSALWHVRIGISARSINPAKKIIR